MSRNLALLLSTCDAYWPFACLTQELLARHWPGHPPLYVCGRSGPEASNQLPFHGSERDWIGITLQALEHLQARGVEWMYLVLDDHPPVGPCNVEYLNRHLPEHAAALGAIQVALQGWDQHQPRQGAPEKRSTLAWQRNDPDFAWKFSLHPGFWHVATLQRLLRTLRTQAPDVTTARAFESRLDGAAATLDPDLRRRTFRVRGDGFATGHHWYERRWSRQLALPTLHLLRFGARVRGGDAPARVDERLLVYLQYLNGPYPMFWSGLIQRRQLNETALRFLVWSGQADVAEAIRRLPLPGPL